MARAATSPELTLFRSPGQWSRVRMAIEVPSTVYTGRINQSFSSFDKILEIIYDAGSGTLGDVLPDMTVYFGSSAGAWDKGIARVRGIDATKVYIGETADIRFSDNDYITIVDSFALWAKPILISSGVAYIDGGTAYSDQFTNFLPLAKMGPNLILHKTGSTVSHTFDFSGSSVPGSTISAYSIAAPGSSAISGGSTATPMVSWNSVGWKKIYLTLTAANGKSFISVRKVFVWDETNEPEPILAENLGRGDVESGGWEISFTLFGSAALSQVRDHALVILFAEDHYGAWDNSTETSIGPVSGAENILFQGWIGKESIVWDNEAGSVSFTAYTAQHFLKQIPAWPWGVQFTTAAPANWTQMQNLTVDLGLYGMLHHATTAPRVMDITLSGDTRYTKEVQSLAGNIWDQIREIAFDQIYARTLVNCLNQLFIEIHPQLTPVASRTFPTVFDILPSDIERPIDFERATMEETSILDLSGLLINSSGNATAFFSLAPGHSHSHYGSQEVQPKRLLSSQAQSNTLAGLYRAWRNNPYKSIPLPLAMNNRLVDIAPLQKCTTTIGAGDTLRGISYSGGLIPVSVERTQDLKSGFIRTSVNFEAEILETDSNATIGDIPGSINVSIPPTPKLPPLPPLGNPLPGTFDLSSGGATAAIMFGDNTSGAKYGLIYTENFDASGPNWRLVNAGLSLSQINAINKICITPSGGIYVAFLGTNGFIAYASSIGATFTIVEDPTSIAAKLPGYTNSVRVIAIGVNPLNGQAAYCISGSSGLGHQAKVYIGSGTSFSFGCIPDVNAGAGDLTYGFGNWRLTAALGSGAHFIALSSSASSIIRDVPFGGVNLYGQVPISTTDAVFMIKSTTGGILRISGNGANGADFSTVYGSLLDEPDPWGNYADCDPTGFYLMAPWDTGNRGKSTDAGATWSGLPSLPFASSWHFSNGGDGSRWAAGGGSMIRWSQDGGTNWLNREGDVSSVAPLLKVEIIKVVGF